MSRRSEVVTTAIVLAALVTASSAFAQWGEGGQAIEQGEATGMQSRTLSQVFDEVRGHDFEPNNTPRETSRGIGDLSDDAWRVRVLAIRDLVRLGRNDAKPLIEAVVDANRHVRHVAVAALGVLGVPAASDALLEALTDDPEPHRSRTGRPGAGPDRS